MIQQSCIDEVKAKANIVEVIGGEGVKLKREGTNWVGLCPFHDEKSPSFKIAEKKDLFKCFGCGVSGDSIEFLIKKKSISYLDAVKHLAAMYHVELLEEGKEPKRNYTKPALSPTKPKENIIKWFETRGITQKTLDDLRVTQGNRWMPIAKSEVPVICFNYYREGELVNVKYRGRNLGGKKDLALEKDAELIFYNLDSIKGKNYVLVVEGEVDCLTIHQCGATQVVSVPNGASVGKMEYMESCIDYFRGLDEIILFTDNDEPGRKLKDELARRFGYDRCKQVDIPDDCKDANDVLVKHGMARVKEIIKNAYEFPIEGIFAMSDLYADVVNYYHNGYPKGISIGIPDFDELIKFMPGQLTVITGIPGMGKSEWLDLMISQFSKMHGWVFGVCSFENQPSSLHVTKIMEKWVGKSFMHRENPEARISQQEFDDSIAEIAERFHFINVSKTDVTIEGLLQKAGQLVVRKGIKGLVIDPWNYIEAKGKKDTEYVAQCLIQIKSFCAKYGVHCFLVAHPVKMLKINGKYDVPNLYSISGSANFFNATDNGICVHRDYENQTVNIYVQKVRYQWLGKIGMATFTFNLETRQYESINKSVEIKPTDNPHAGIGKQYRDITEPEKYEQEDLPF
jgi:twinkle protein